MSRTPAPTRLVLPRFRGGAAAAGGARHAAGAGRWTSDLVGAPGHAGREAALTLAGRPVRLPLRSRPDGLPEPGAADFVIMSGMRDTAGLNKMQKLEAKKPKPRCRTGTPRDGSWRPRFLAALRQLANIGYACEYARVSRTTATRHRERSAQFRAAWDNALKEAVEKDELRLSDYANRGVPETVFLPSETLEEERVRWVKGPDGKVRAVPQKWRKQTYVERVVYKPSVTALIFRLKAYAPEKYREASQTHITNTPPQTAIAVKVETSIDRLPDAELDRILSQAAARGAFSAEALDQLQVAVPHLLPAAKGAGGDAAAPVAADETEL